MAGAISGIGGRTPLLPATDFLSSAVHPQGELLGRLSLWLLSLGRARESNTRAEEKAKKDMKATAREILPNFNVTLS